MLFNPTIAVKTTTPKYDISLTPKYDILLTPKYDIPLTPKYDISLISFLEILSSMNLSS